MACALAGGMPIPIIEPLGDIDDGAFVDEDEDLDLDAPEIEAEEAFDIDEAMRIEVEDDEL